MKSNRILIIYASYGSGHKAVANYIADYIKSQNKDLEVATLDILTYSMNVIGSISQKINSFFMLKVPVIHGFFYGLCGTKIGGDVLDNISTTIFKNKKMERQIKNFNPTMTICTHFYGSSLIKYYNDKKIINSKMITIITDYDVIESWIKYHKDICQIVVANNEMKKDLIRRKVDKDKINVFGIPIAPKVEEKFDRNKSLLKYNLTGKNLTCVFFGGGGNGSSKTLPYIKKVAKSNPNLDIIFIAGKNEKSKNAIDEYIENNNLKNVRTIGFATNVPELLQLSDFVISKPGGIQLTECLYFKKPILMIRNSGGQEIANYKYFQNEGYGRYFHFPWTLNKYVASILNDKTILKNLTNNIKKNDSNDAIEKVYELIINNLK